MSHKLYVGGLAWATTDESLRDFFAATVTVETASVVTDRDSGRSRGFGFVEVPTQEDMQTAIDKINGTELDGRTISVSEARPKTDRPRGDFGGGRGGNGGGRSGGYDNNKSW